jgi:hypothetical protein
MIIITLLIYLLHTKTLAENHKFVGVIGNTIFKEYGNGLFATGFDIPNSWDNADIALAQGAPAEGTCCRIYVYDERRLSYFGRLQYDYKGNIFCLQ